MRQFHDQPPNVEAALQYASRGWAVLPMHGKKFYTRDGVRIATRDPSIIKKWGWAENVGMACGEPSQTDVFDIDDFRSGRFRSRRAGRFNAGRNNAIRRAALILRVCRTSQPSLSLGRVAIDGTRSGAAAWIGTGVDQWQGARTCASGAS